MIVELRVDCDDCRRAMVYALACSGYAVWCKSRVPYQGYTDRIDGDTTEYYVCFDYQPEEDLESPLKKMMLKGMGGDEG